MYCSANHCVQLCSTVPRAVSIAFFAGPWLGNGDREADDLRCLLRWFIFSVLSSRSRSGSSSWTHMEIVAFISSMMWQSLEMVVSLSAMFANSHMQFQLLRMCLFLGLLARTSAKRTVDGLITCHESLAELKKFSAGIEPAYIVLFYTNQTGW